MTQSKFPKCIRCQRSYRGKPDLCSPCRLEVDILSLFAPGIAIPDTEIVAEMRRRGDHSARDVGDALRRLVTGPHPELLMTADVLPGRAGKNVYRLP